MPRNLTQLRNSVLWVRRRFASSLFNCDHRFSSLLKPSQLVSIFATLFNSSQSCSISPPLSSTIFSRNLSVPWHLEALALMSLTDTVPNLLGKSILSILWWKSVCHMSRSEKCLEEAQQFTADESSLHVERLTTNRNLVSKKSVVRSLLASAGWRAHVLKPGRIKICMKNLLPHVHVWIMAWRQQFATSTTV